MDEKVHHSTSAAKSGHVQADNHIVLRLARDTVANTNDDRWQVLSLSGHGALCKVGQKVSSGKCKKVTRPKQKISVTICKSGIAAKQSNKRKVGHKMKIKKNFASATTVLNSVSVTEHGDIKQKDAKETVAFAADCCDFCVSANVKKLKAVTRKSRTGAVTHRDSCAQSENLFEAVGSGNVNKIDDITNNVDDMGSVTADHFEMAIDSESLLIQKEDIYQHVDNWQKGNRLNGKFGALGDSRKTRRQRKVMLELKTSKDCCRVKERVTEANDVKTEIVAAETVDVPPVSVSNTLNNDAVGCGISVSRRARPVKNRRLMDSCFVFGQTVKTRRPRKTAEKQPAAAAIVNPECMIAESSETNSDHLQSMNDPTNHASIIGDKSDCNMPESKSPLCTVSESRVLTAEYEKHNSPVDLHVLCPLNEFSEDSSQFDVHGNMCMPKLSPELSHPVSDTALMLLDRDCMTMIDVEEKNWMAADDCKYDMTCDAPVTEDVFPTESNSPPIDGMHLFVEDCSVDSWQLPSVSENSCYGYDDSDQADDPVLATWPVEMLHIEPTLNSTVKGDCCMAGNSITETQPADSEMYDISANYCDGLSCIPDLNQNSASYMGSHLLDAVPNNAEANLFTMATEVDCLLAGKAGNIEVCADVLNNTMDSATCTVNSVSVEVEEFIYGNTGTTELPDDIGDTGTGELSNDAVDDDAVLFPCASTESTELNKISDSAPALSGTANHDESHSICSDEVITDSEIVNHSIPKSVVCSRTSVSRKPAKRSTTSRHRISNTQIHSTKRNRRTHRKRVTESTGTEFRPNSLENCAKLMNVAVCSEENCEGMPADEHNFGSEMVIAGSSETPIINFCSDKVITTDADSAIVTHNIPESVVCGSATESNIPVKKAATSRHRRNNNTHQSHRARRKTAGENSGTDLLNNLAETSTKIMDVAIFGEESPEELPAADHSLAEAEVVIASGSDTQIVNQSIYLPDLSRNASTECSLPAEITASSGRRRRNSHRSHRARLKVGSENAAEDICHGSAERCTDGTVSSEEKHEPAVITGDLDRLRHKSVEDDKVEEIQGSSLETESQLGTRKKHHHSASSSAGCNGDSDVRCTKSIHRASSHTDTNSKHTSDELSSLCGRIKQSLSVDHMDISSCLVAMSMLQKLPVTSHILAKNADILVTIKKCRKFKGSEAVRRQAGLLYDKFRTLFHLSADSAGHAEASSVDGRRHSSSDGNPVASSRHHGSGGSSRSETTVQRHRTMSVPATVSSVSSDRCLEASSDCNQIVADKDITDNVSAESSISASRSSPDCAVGNVNAQATNNLPRETIDKSVAAKISSSDAETVAHLHRTDNNLLDDSVDLETTDNKWKNFVVVDTVPAPDTRSQEGYELVQENVSSRTSPHDYRLIQENIPSWTVGDSVSSADETLLQENVSLRIVDAFSSPAGKTLPHESAGSGEVGVNRRRRISAARSALYHRLLSSEAGGSSDVDDIFDVQSLCSDGDDDSNDSDLNLSDHSCLNPSDSELEDRITQIIAEEDEEIIQQHCYSYRSRHAATMWPHKPVSHGPPSTVTRPSLTVASRVCDTTESSRPTTTAAPAAAADTAASDIDDDELHQLLGVD